MARPSFKPSAAQRRKVSVAAGAGMRHEDIAIALAISPPTLRKHFETELSVGANSRRLEVLNALFVAAKKGSSSAAKAYLAVEPQLAAPPAEGAQPAAPVAPAQTLAKPLGKKEQAQQAAVGAQAGTEWDNLLPAGGARPPIQ